MELQKPWKKVASSEALKPGNIIEVALDGVDLVVWRGASGKPCVMEARCPHQWSHLGTEGAVEGDEIVCLAHFWRFTQDGKGWKQNMAGRRDRKGDIAVYECQETAGAIWMWPPSCGVD